MNVQPVVVTQPQFLAAQPARGYWQTDVWDCCSDCGVCLCGLFFPLCLGCQVASDMNECCCCGASATMRSVYRTKYKIPGSICKDCCIVYWCTICSLCQVKRDIKRRKEQGIF